MPSECPHPLDRRGERSLVIPRRNADADALEARPNLLAAEQPEPVREPVPVPAEPLATDTLASSDIDAINKNSPFQPVFFALDQDTID